MSDHKAVYDKLTAEMERRTSADKRVQSVLKKIENGKATLSDTFALAADKGRLLGAVFRENLADLDPQTTEKVYDMLMRDMQREITDKMAAVQRAADEKHGISLGAPRPTYPAERIAKIAASLHDTTVPPETLARRAQSATETVTMAFHDDYVRDNAEFRSDAGFPCFIDRIADGGCCKWCAAMAGHYEFGEEPPDMWCRHDNCRCEIVYANGYKVQSLRGTKKSWDIKTDHSYEEYRAKQPDKKTAESAEKYEPKTLTREQAAQAEAEGLAKYANTLDSSAGSGIIVNEQSKKAVTEITDRAIERVPKIKIDGYTDEQCELIRQQHKELLKYSRDNNENKEVAFVMDSSMTGRKVFSGSDDKLDFGSELYGKDLFVMHNHPRNGSYSDTDIAFILSNDNIRSLSIVKNSGSVEVLTKTTAFNKEKAMNEFRRSYKKYVRIGNNLEIDKAVEKFINKYKEGLLWVTSK